ERLGGLLRAGGGRAVYQGTRKAQTAAGGVPRQRLRQRRLENQRRADFQAAVPDHGSEIDLMSDDSTDMASADDGAAPKPAPAVRYYYVDEAGDSTLFNARGRVIVGSEGCSRFFILGKLEVVQPDHLADALLALRKRLLADPYFK